jgi:hypothetical protein
LTIAAEIGYIQAGSFALRLAAEGKAAKTILTCTEAVRWFAAACPGGSVGSRWTGRTSSSG